MELWRSVETPAIIPIVETHCEATIESDHTVGRQSLLAAGRRLSDQLLQWDRENQPHLLHVSEAFKLPLSAPRCAFNVGAESRPRIVKGIYK